MPDTPTPPTATVGISSARGQANRTRRHALAGLQLQPLLLAFAALAPPARDVALAEDGSLRERLYAAMSNSVRGLAWSAVRCTDGVGIGETDLIPFWQETSLSYCDAERELARAVGVTREAVYAPLLARGAELDAEVITRAAAYMFERHAARDATQKTDPELWLGVRFAVRERAGIIVPMLTPDTLVAALAACSDSGDPDELAEWLVRDRVQDVIRALSNYEERFFRGAAQTAC